jgi:hypothetical protein
MPITTTENKYTTIEDASLITKLSTDLRNVRDFGKKLSRENTSEGTFQDAIKNISAAVEETENGNIENGNISVSKENISELEKMLKKEIQEVGNIFFSKPSTKFTLSELSIIKKAFLSVYSPDEKTISQ